MGAKLKIYNVVEMDCLVYKKTVWAGVLAGAKTLNKFLTGFFMKCI